MVSHPIVIIILLLVVVGIVLFLSKNDKTKSVFKYFPVPLWCYFIPTLLSASKLIPSDLPLYGNLSRFLLPACLFLLLIGTHVHAIAKLSRQSLIAMIIGSVGIWVGGTLTFLILSQYSAFNEIWTSREILNGWGCLGATWTGGSMNMIAVKEILHTQESLFSNLILTDTVVSYGWMAVLIFLSQYQIWIDKKLGTEMDISLFREKQSQSSFRQMPRLAGRMPKSSSNDTANDTLSSAYGIWRQLSDIAVLLAVSFVFSYGCSFLSKFFQFLFTPYTWVIIFATFIPVALSMNRLNNLEAIGASKIGNILLLFLLTTIGARANLTHLNTVPVFIFAGLLWVAIHGITLFFGGKIFRIPISILATASQANIGGTVSAPLVAVVYNKEIASIAVILAVLGNIYGTYAGIFLSFICRQILNLL